MSDLLTRLRRAVREQAHLGEVALTLGQATERALEPLRAHASEEVSREGTRREGLPPRPPNPARVVQQALGTAMGFVNLPVELMNAGFAAATASVPSVPLPPASLGTLYVGPPHGHLHPPSFTPPATPAPVPLPSLGPVALGTSLQVLIAGRPAARAGDLGFAVTCVGLMPVFEVFLGSSKVFMGGMRAARLGDLCRACQPSLAGPVRGMAKAMQVAGVAMGVAGVAADGIDAAGSSDGAMAQAQALSAAMGAAQTALDAATLALTATMGVDLAVPPSMGALLAIPTAPLVLVGGFPMINLPNPAMLLLERIRGRLMRRLNRRAAGSSLESDGTPTAGAVSCPRGRGGH